MVDADGLAVSPGSIDVHAHADLAVLTDREHLSATTQGVTTQVLGQDGSSCAPVDDAVLAVLREQLVGWNGVGEDLVRDWRSVGDHLDAVDRGAAVDVCHLVPQGTVRMLVVGSQDRPATPGEVATMRAVVATGLRQDAVGTSSGLTHPPGMHADTDELVALCEVVAALRPGWASARGPADSLERLGDLRRIRADLEVHGSDGCRGVVVDRAAVAVIGVRHPELSASVGATIAQLAAARGSPAVAVCVDLLVRDRLGTTVLQHVGDEDDVRAIMAHRVRTAGSDGLLTGARPHPRAFGTFARYLGRCVRELGVLDLEECVAAMTSRPARRPGLVDRGVLRAGAVADVVLFDPSGWSTPPPSRRPTGRRWASSTCWCPARRSSPTGTAPRPCPGARPAAP